MTTYIRDYREGEEIADANDNIWYTFEELDGGVFVDSDDTTGAESFMLRDGRIATLQSIDLDWFHDDNKNLATTSAPHLYENRVDNV